MRKHQSAQGIAVRLLLLLVIGVTIGGAVWWFLSGRSGRGEDASDLAQYIPESTHAMVALDLRVNGSWDKILESTKDGSNDQLATIEQKSGVPVRAVAEYLDGRLVLATFKSEDQTTGACIVGLESPDDLRYWIEDRAGDTNEEIEGVPFWKYDDVYLAVEGDWALMVSDSKGASELVDVLRGRRKNLQSSPRYQQALKQLPELPSELLGYADVQSVVTELREVPQLKLAGFDATAFNQLAELDFAIAQFSGEALRADGLLAVASVDGNLAKRLTTPGEVQTKYLKEFSKDTSYVCGLDSKWFLDFTVALGQLNSNSRSKSAMIPLGLMALGSPYTAFHGDVWVGTDALDKVASLGAATKGATPEIPSVKVVIPVKSEEAAKKMADDKLNYLTQLLITTEINSETLTLSFGGFVPGLGGDDGSMATVSQIKKLKKWGGDGIVYLDATNLEGMLNALVDYADQPIPQELIRQMEELRENGGLRGYSCVKAGPEGLQFQMRGNAGGVPIYAGALGAVLVPNFLKSRSQGQLTACKSNLKNLGTGCEMWATDNGGKYPEELSVLTPLYLRTIPKCPVADKDTYSESYSLGGPYNGYYFYCSGHHHADVGIPRDFPKYDHQRGLTER